MEVENSSQKRNSLFEALNLQNGQEEDEELEDYKTKREKNERMYFDQKKILKALISHRSHIVLYGYHHSMNNSLISELLGKNSKFVTVNILLTNTKSAFLSEISLRLKEKYKESLKEVKTLEDFVEMFRCRKEIVNLYEDNIYIVLKNCERLAFTPKFLASFIRVCNYGKLPFSLIFEAISIPECFVSSYEFTMIPKFHVKSDSDKDLADQIDEYFEEKLPHYSSFYAANLVQTFSYLTKDFEAYKNIGNLLFDSLLKFHNSHLLENQKEKRPTSNSKKSKNSKEKQENFELCDSDFTFKNINYTIGKKILLRDPYVHYSLKEFNNMIENEKNLPREFSIAKNYFKNDYSTIPKLGKIILLAAFLGNRNKELSDHKIFVETDIIKKSTNQKLTTYKTLKPVKIHRLLAICQSLMQHSHKYTDESMLFNQSVDFYATLANLVDRNLLLRVNSKSNEICKASYISTIEKDFAKDISNENDLKIDDFLIESLIN